MPRPDGHLQELRPLIGFNVLFILHLWDDDGLKPARMAYIKIMILSGYHDFCTVHRVIVE